jgi:hypothetical protein
MMEALRSSETSVLTREPHDVTSQKAVFFLEGIIHNLSSVGFEPMFHLSTSYPIARFAMQEVSPQSPPCRILILFEPHPVTVLRLWYEIIPRRG